MTIYAQITVYRNIVHLYPQLLHAMHVFIEKIFWTIYHSVVTYDEYEKNDKRANSIYQKWLPATLKTIPDIFIIYYFY